MMLFYLGTFGMELSAPTLRYTKTAGLLLLAASVALLFAPEEYNVAVAKVFDVLTLLTVVWVLVAVWIAIKFRSFAYRSLVVLTIVFVAGPFLFGFGGLRVRVPANVAIDSRPVRDARVYRGWNGETAVMLHGESEPFVYVPARNDVFYCSASTFVDFHVVGWQQDASLCMPSAKQEIPLDLRMNGNELSFNVPQANKPQGAIERVTVRRY
jgi:hypothetical protein